MSFLDKFRADPMKVRTERVVIMKETSLWTSFCEEARMRAHTSINVFLAFVHLYAAPPRPITTPKHSAWSLICTCCKTGTWVPTHSASHVPVLDPMALLVIKGHASHTVNGRKGARHKRQGLADRSRSLSEVIGVGTSTSLQAPRTVRFKRQDVRHDPTEDRAKCHGE